MKPRILVIDDEAAIRDSLRMILEYENYEFVGAASGPDGLAIIKRDAPDLVLLDIKMPAMNGLETLTEIRKVDEALPVRWIPVSALEETVVRPKYVFEFHDVTLNSPGYSNDLSNSSLALGVRHRMND